MYSTSMSSRVVPMHMPVMKPVAERACVINRNPVLISQTCCDAVCPSPRHPEHEDDGDGGGIVRHDFVRVYVEALAENGYNRDP